MEKISDIQKLYSYVQYIQSELSKAGHLSAAEFIQQGLDQGSSATEILYYLKDSLESIVLDKSIEPALLTKVIHAKRSIDLLLNINP
jgi:hypothetical protein